MIEHRSMPCPSVAHLPRRRRDRVASRGLCVVIAWVALSAVVVRAAGGVEDTAGVEVPETSLEGIIIEAEPIQSEPSIEERFERFREILGGGQPLAPSAGALAGGGTELSTRYGRFCVPVLPVQPSSDLAAGSILAARCSMF